MGRISKTFSELEKQKKKALIAYIVAGDPDLSCTLKSMHLMVSEGVNIIELGVAFSDPMAEAWLRELLRIAVREYGLSALATTTIEESASSLLGDRSGMELDLWLEGLFRQGKLVKIHGGDRTGYGPNPKWLDARM